MRTVPLHGKYGAGQVALVDDEDHDLVAQYRWFVKKNSHPTPPGRRECLYASAYVRGSGRKGPALILMHVLIMGRPYIDHRDHDGLNNQRSNLRPADQSQNNQNQRPQIGRTSQYKGVYFSRQKRMWHASIKLNGRKRDLGFYVSEMEAAYAYDAGAREMFGEFACPNFPDEPTRAMREQWRADAEARRTRIAAEARRVVAAQKVDWWAQREPETRVCVICGEQYQARSVQESFYCSNRCRCRAKVLRKREREAEGRLF